MSLLIAILLGAVQGVTEFLPISSSGHLVLIGGLVELDNHFTFDVLLNLGTLAALGWCFRGRLMEILRLLRNNDYGVLLKLIVATLPAIFVGAIFHQQLVGLNTNIPLVLVMLALLGLVMLFVDEKKGAKENLVDVSWKMALVVGLAQAIAFLPGTSRAGITILVALMLGMKRNLAAEWSFLLAIPIIAAAIAKVLFSAEAFEFVSNNFGSIIVGNIVSFTVGFLAIDYLVRLLRRQSLRPFAVYRLALVAVLLIFLATPIL